jgi:dTDP-4-dehydrorhamnose reductase
VAELKANVSNTYVIGAGGYIGSVIVRHAQSLRHVKVFSVTSGSATTRKQAKDPGLLAGFEAFCAQSKVDQPRCLILCCGSASVDLAEKNPHLSIEANIVIPAAYVAEAIKRNPDVLIVCISSTYVYGHDSPLSGFSEADAPCPSSIYGLHKLEMEQIIQSQTNEHLIVRIPWAIGNAHHTNDFIRNAALALTNRQSLRADNKLRFPTDVEHIAAAVWLLIKRNLRGTFHITSDESASRLQIAQYINKLLGHASSKNVQEDVNFDSEGLRPHFLRLTTRSEALKQMSKLSWRSVVERELRKVTK